VRLHMSPLHQQLLSLTRVTKVSLFRIKRTLLAPTLPAFDHGIPALTALDIQSRASQVTTMYPLQITQKKLVVQIHPDPNPMSPNSQNKPDISSILLFLINYTLRDTRDRAICSKPPFANRMYQIGIVP